MTRFEEYTREELRGLAPQALVVLPVGATEQHGPHLPVGVDTYSVSHIAHAAAARVPEEIPVLVAPTLPYGSSHHHIPFGGTLSLSTETYLRTINDLVESLILSGFQRIFILNGHGGNNELIQLTARDMALRHMAHIAAASYWSIAWEALIASKAQQAGGLPGHAGIFETSLMLALHPQLIREPRPKRENPGSIEIRGYNPYRAELHGAWQRMDGYTDSPDLASAELGEQHLNVIINEVSKAFGSFYQHVSELV